MTATTEDLDTSSRQGRMATYGVGGGSLLFALALCCVDSDGYLVDGVDATGLRFAGVADTGVDNSDGADGDESCAVHVEGCFKFAASGLTRGDVGKRLYLLDNQTVGLVGDGNLDFHIYVGRMAQYVSADEVWVRIEPLAQDVQQYTVKVAGTNAAALTANLATAAAAFGGSGFYVTAVQSMEGYTTADGTSAGIYAETTDYTVASGVITMVGNKSAKTLVITFTGRLS